MARRSRIQVRSSSRFSYGSRAVATAAPTRSAATTSSRSDPEYVAAQLRNIMTSRDHQALLDLQSGKLMPFITYAEERIKHPLDEEDAARWNQLLDDAHAKAEETAVAHGVASNDIPLEDALKFLTERRSQYEPSDPRFADLTQQIGDTKNAIAARDFNAELNTAVSDLVNSGNTIAAKQKYLQKLMEVLPRAKDPKAQSTIQQQMMDLQDAITKDKITARSTETSAKLVAYYNGTMTGPDVQNYLLDKANTALSSQEAAAYATAASQVATRERTIQQQRVARASSASSGAGVAKAVAAALAPLSKGTDTAVKTFGDSTKRTGVPDATAFGVLKQATQLELDTIEKALSDASPAAADALIKRRDALLANVNTVQRAAATKTVQAERDATTAFNQSIDTLRKQGAPYEETAQLAARRIAAVQQASAQPWMTGYEQDPTLGGDLATMEQTTRKILTDEAAISTGTLTGQTATTKKLQTEYERYRDYFVKKGVEVPMGLDEWHRTVVNATDAKELNTALKLPTDPTSNADMRVEMDNVKQIHAARHQEVQAASANLIAASWPRDLTGGKVSYGAPSPADGAPSAGGRPGFFDPTRGGLFDSSTFGPLVAGHQRGGAQQADTPAGPAAPSAGSGVADAGGATSVASPQQQDQAPPTDEMAQMNALAKRRAELSKMDPHDAADAYLSDPVTFQYPTWEIPALPDWGAFASGNHLDAGNTDSYMPPALPQSSSFSLPALPGPSSFQPPSGGGGALDAGVGYQPPALPAGIGSTAAGGGSGANLMA